MKTIALGLSLTALASPAFADQIMGESRVSHVILYPEGASVTRQAELTAPAGTHELILPDLPAGTDPSALRISAEGATLASVALQQGRALPDGAGKPAAVEQAEQALREANDALRFFDRDLQALETKADVLRQRAQITRDLLKGDSRLPTDEIAETVAQMGTLIESLLEQADEQEFRAAMMTPDRIKLKEELARARAALDAVRNEGADHETLVLTVETTGQPAQFAITGFTGQAGWVPNYDLRLDREAETLAMNRGVQVWQASGEDWQDVTLTLSTARPQGHTDPTEVQPWMPQIGSQPPAQPMAEAVQMQPRMRMRGDMPAPSPIGGAQMSRMGVTVVYDYPGAVTIRDGVDALRLSLDDKSLTPEILAEAAPRHDDSAYLIAETVNSLDEPILPGETTFYADGAMVGRGHIGLTAAGDKLRFGFGPIDGLRAEMRVPDEQEGDQGIIRRRNNRQETVTLIVENLTDEEWPLRIVDRVPVSRQEDLEIDWSASIDPTEQDPDGKRGVLYWQAPIAPGETREITVETTMTWPEDQVLLP